MKNKFLFFLSLIIMGTAAYLVHTPHELVAPKIPELASIPKQMGPWYSARDTTFDEGTLRILRPTDYMMRTYMDKKGVPVTLYIGYHDGSPLAGPIHSPKNCLPGGGWEFRSTEEIPMTAGDNSINVVRAVLAKDGNESIFYYWYQVRGKVITSDLDMKIAEFVGTVVDKRKDAAFVRINLTAPSKEQEVKIMQDFFENAYPVIKNHLPS